MDGQHLSDNVIRKNYKSLQATMVDRRNPSHPSQPLMLSVDVKTVIEAGTTINMLDETKLSAHDLPQNYPIQPTNPEEIMLSANWKNKNMEQAKSGRDASVFGGLGVLLASVAGDTICIPKMNALAVHTSFLQKYGAELIPLNQPIPIEPAEHESLQQLYLVEYYFNQRYVPEYALKMDGGGGIFVETHPFPQLFTPLSPHCSGGLILGVNRGNHEYDFASFEIPFGYTMKIKSMVIHGDSFFVGPYAIALNETELADSVLFRKNTSNRDIQKIKQVAVEPVKIPLRTECILSGIVNKKMLIDKFLHADKNIKYQILLFKDSVSQTKHIKGEMLPSTSSSSSSIKQKI